MLVGCLGCEWEMAGAPCAESPTPCLDGYVCCSGRCERSCGAPSESAPSESAASESAASESSAGEPNATLSGSTLGTWGSCAELPAGSASGLYRIEGLTGSYRAYCDAAHGVELCTEALGEHRGVSKDPSELAFTMTSVLEGDACRVWNVKAESDGRPLDALEFFDDDLQFVSVDPCLPLGLPKALGFRRADGCPYGSNPGYGACGYDPKQDGTGPMKWSNGCLSCRVNGGNSHGYVLQGEIYTSLIPWDASGQFSMVCGP
jgi:hypothetical protein